MGRCKLCYEDAGWFRKEHGHCRERHGQAVAEIYRIGVDAALRGQNFDSLVDQIRRTAASGRVSIRGASGLELTLARSWQLAIDECLSSSSFGQKEWLNLNAFRVRYSLGEHVLDKDGHFEAFRMMCLLAFIRKHGKAPRFGAGTPQGRLERLPFNIAADEEMLWVFQGVPYHHQVTRTEFESDTRGESYRDKDGTRERTGHTSGRSVTFAAMEHADSGNLGFTTRRIYFGGSVMAFRAAHNEFVSITPQKDGITISRDAANGTPELFILNPRRATFIANLITELIGMGGVTLPGSDDPTLDEIANRILV